MLEILKGAGLSVSRARFLCIALVAVVLAACGGGGGSSGDDLVSRHPVSPNTLSLAVAPTAVSDQSPSTVTLTLTDRDGQPVSGQEVTLSCDATARLADNRVTTDLNGQATTRLYAMANGGGTLKASFRDSEGTGSASKSFSTTLSSSGGTGTGSGTTSLILDLTDSAGQVVGTTNSPITQNRAGTVKATLLDPDGAPLPNKVISFQADIGQLLPSSGTALTDAQGVAEITLEAGQEQGAGTVVATYNGADESAAQQISFSTLGDSDGGSSGAGGTEILIGSGTGTNFQDGVLTLSSSPIGAGSSLAITASVVNASDKQPVSSPVQVTFSSTCELTGKASFDPNNKNTVGGAATVSYQPENGCENDVITASATVNSQQKTASSGTLTITQSPPNSIEFVGADPAVLGLKGSSNAGAPETSTLSFLVKNSNGQPVTSVQVVDFSVVSGNGGFNITSSTSTNSQGVATAVVQSGTVPSVASVRAQLHDDPSISATGSVSIQSGVVAQDRFTMAVKTLNPAAGNHPGTEVQVTVRAADRLGNWPPNGTPVQFTTELGQMPASCELEDGTCSVTWASQGPQPIHYDVDRAGRAPCFNDANERAKQGLSPGLGCGANDHFGRSTISATTVGEEAFTDGNGNNIYDIGEEVDHLPEAFRDDNETGLFEGVADGFGEEFKDYIHNGQYDQAQSKFRGVGCSTAATSDGNCDQLANVRASSVIALSTDEMQLYVYGGSITSFAGTWVSSGDHNKPPQQWGDAFFNGPTQTSSVDVSTPGTITVIVADLNGNAPALNTKVEFDPGSAQVFGSNNCVAGNQLGALVCQFSYGPPDSTPTTYKPMVITATSGGDDSLTVSRVITVTP